MSIFPEIKKNFGFGCMRLPMNGDEVDFAEFSRMIDIFIASGFNYFDTAHGYLGGKSETAIRECLSKRYPREAFLLTNKLSHNHFEKNEDIRPLFESQLAACGVEYFDFYLMHAQNKQKFEKYKACRAYETAFELKAEGKVKHVGLSFHDKAVVLDTILSEYPQIEAVQIQFNYADYDDASVEGKKVYDVCRKHGKPIIVMEPVKGGSLVNLPDEAKAVFDELGGGSPASYAIRYAASFEGMFMVLSGMGSVPMIEENVGFMKDFRPLNAEEFAAVERVCELFRAQNLIACTACGYCTERCPQNIPIPRIFSILNNKKRFKNANAERAYAVSTQNGGKASTCRGCGLCEGACPQNLEIRELLQEAAEEFEK